MAIAETSFAADVGKVRKEIEDHQKELSSLDTEREEHSSAIAQAEARRQYIQDLIEAKKRMTARYGRLAAAKPARVRRRRPGRPPKAVLAARRPRRGGGARRVAAPAVEVAFQRFASMTVTDAAEHVLREAGKPVHLKEIAAQLVAGGKAFRAKKPEVSILTMISKDKRFRNTGRNVWTLV